MPCQESGRTRDLVGIAALILIHSLLSFLAMCTASLIHPTNRDEGSYQLSHAYNRFLDTTCSLRVH